VRYGGQGAGQPRLVVGAAPLAAVGVVMAIWWVRGLEPHPDRAPGRRSRVLGSGAATMRRQRVVRFGIAAAVGLGTWVLTGWPVGGVAAGAAAFFLPAFFTVGRLMQRRIERLEALEEWVRRLADSMAVGGAPVATIVRSAARAPEAIRPEVSELAGRLGTARWDRSVALRQFADRIDDSLGDLIALALEIAVSARASERVPGVLRQMADAAADEVKARRQIEVDRAAPRNRGPRAGVVQHRGHRGGGLHRLHRPLRRSARAGVAGDPDGGPGRVDVVDPQVLPRREHAPDPDLRFSTG